MMLYLIFLLLIHYITSFIINNNNGYINYSILQTLSKDSLNIPKYIHSNNYNNIKSNKIVKNIVHMGIFSSFFGSKMNPAKANNNRSNLYTMKATNSVARIINGIKHKRLGGYGDIIVSEIGLGTQRWVSDDFNAPDESLCFDFLDKAVLENGINLIDTAEQYPIPSSPKNPEGLVESTIGKWMKKHPGSREKVVISSKITGGRNINRQNIFNDLENSLKRLGTDYMDIYLLHWPARYTPQSNWGQSLTYQYEMEKYYNNHASFEEIAQAMGDLIKQGKLRGWGMCNDNAYGLTASCYIAKQLGVPPPVTLQNDFSIINRRIEENGVSEASSPINENVGFMAYNSLAGGILTGKYLNGPPVPYDDPNPIAASIRAQINKPTPRGRHDDSWGRTLYRYRSEPAMQATLAYNDIAKRYGLTLTDLSLRWCRQRRSVTTVLLGQTSMKQLDEDIKIFQNQDDLSDEIMWEIDRIHMRNRLPIFSSTKVGKDWFFEGEIGEMIP